MDVLVCEECGEWSDHEARGWAGYIVQQIEGDEPPSVLVFCPECAAGKFGHRGVRDDDASEDNRS
jgi:hypothetical protein